MHRIAIPLFLAVPAAAAAVPHPPRPPAPVPVPVPVVVNQDPHFSCQIDRRGADGVVSVSRRISPSGAPGPSFAMWVKQFGPDGVSLVSGWEAPAPMDSSFVQLSYQNKDSRRAYRFRVQRSVPNGEQQLLFESGLLRPPDGALNVFTEWGPLSHMLAGAADPRILIVRSDGMIVRSDPIDPEIFGRVVATAAALQPEVDAMVADYRNRCPFIQPDVVY